MPNAKQQAAYFAQQREQVPGDSSGRGGEPAPSSEVRALRVAAEVEPEFWLECVLAGLANGNALLVGRTSDGGALALHFFHGEERYREYPSSSDDLRDTLLAYKRLGPPKVGGGTARTGSLPR